MDQKDTIEQFVEEHKESLKQHVEVVENIREMTIFTSILSTLSEMGIEDEAAADVEKMFFSTGEQAMEGVEVDTAPMHQAANELASKYNLTFTLDEDFRETVITCVTFVDNKPMFGSQWSLDSFKFRALTDEEKQSIRNTMEG